MSDMKYISLRDKETLADYAFRVTDELDAAREALNEARHDAQQAHGVAQALERQVIPTASVTGTVDAADLLAEMARLREELGVERGTVRQQTATIAAMECKVGEVEAERDAAIERLTAERDEARADAISVRKQLSEERQANAEAIFAHHEDMSERDKIAADLVGERDRALALLRGVEWLPGTLSPNRLCPVCHAVECDGHHAGCRLEAAVKDTP